MVVGALMLLCQPAIADDLDDLKATHQKLIMAINTGDVETMFAMMDDKVVRLGSNDGVPHALQNKEFKEQIKHGYMKWFETHLTQHFWYKPDYRIIGNTGLVWGLLEWNVINKTSGLVQRSHLKGSCTYVKSDGKWILVLTHDSSIPPTQTLY